MIKKVLIALVVVGVLILFFKPTTYSLPPNLTYYWGNGCPHCKIVADFLSTWDKKDKVIIEKKEIWGDSANAKELEARYTFCKITSPSEMGVPLLFTPDGKCFSGDINIINYFKDIK